ncbi:hypothetical protein GL503_15175 [Salmonella enterica]|uniref:Uncharacterized protein n=1 Tax=Salmonella enterica I TaxID=59201 RepID=A0A3R1AUM2_SALET|nr:hypothetical protein [Salmonella enterica subsp. enterica serovar Dahomey]ECG2271185.1 hypothetical protein [Salmonella enterica subsp. enterica serovar Eastbourne]EEB7408439.1 hypothetical protein [Salmonella enterica]MML53812.1 hypothetical protein [Salmonella enterica subsp. enterica serovar Kidderminster]
MPVMTTGKRAALREPTVYKIDWLNPCERCQCHRAIEVTGRSLSGRYLCAGDVVKCPGCGNQGEIDTDGDGAWVEWDTEREE